MPDDRADPSAEAIAAARVLHLLGPMAIARGLEEAVAQAVQRERERCAQIAKRQATNANGLRPSEWTACAEFIAGAICMFSEDAAMEAKAMTETPPLHGTLGDARIEIERLKAEVAALREAISAEIENLQADADNDSGRYKSLRAAFDELCAVIGIERGNECWPVWIENVRQHMARLEAPPGASAMERAVDAIQGEMTKWPQQIARAIEQAEAAADMAGFLRGREAGKNEAALEAGYGSFSAKTQADIAAARAQAVTVFQRWFGDDIDWDEALGEIIALAAKPQP